MDARRSLCLTEPPTPYEVYKTQDRYMDCCYDWHAFVGYLVFKKEKMIVRIPRLSETPGSIRTPAPEIGEHNAEVLGALGLDLEELINNGIIGEF